MDVHLVSEKHKKFVNDSTNFNIVREINRSLPSVDDFLKKVAKVPENAPYPVTKKSDMCGFPSNVPSSNIPANEGLGCLMLGNYDDYKEDCNVYNTADTCKTATEIICASCSTAEFVKSFPFDEESSKNDEYSISGLADEPHPKVLLDISQNLLHRASLDVCQEANIGGETSKMIDSIFYSGNLDQPNEMYTSSLVKSMGDSLVPPNVQLHVVHMSPFNGVNPHEVQCSSGGRDSIDETLNINGCIIRKYPFRNFGYGSVNTTCNESIPFTSLLKTDVAGPLDFCMESQLKTDAVACSLDFCINSQSESEQNELKTFHENVDNLCQNLNSNDEEDIDNLSQKLNSNDNKNIANVCCRNLNSNDQEDVIDLRVNKMKEK